MNTAERSTRAYVDTNVWIHYFYRPHDPDARLRKQAAATRFFEETVSNANVQIVMNTWGYDELLGHMLNRAQDYKVFQLGFWPDAIEFREAKKRPNAQLSETEKRDVNEKLDKYLAHFNVQPQTTPLNLPDLRPLVLNQVQLADAVHHQQADALKADYLVTQDGHFQHATRHVQTPRVVTLEQINRHLQTKPQQ